MGALQLTLVGIELLAVAAVGVDVILDEHALAAARHLLALGDQVLLDHRRRQVPHRVEVELVDRRVQDRRRPVGLADDAGMARDDAIVVDHLDLRRGDVDEHVLLGRRLARLREALEVGLELLEARGGRHVERRDGALVDDAGRRQPVGGLIALHRLVDVEVEAVRAGRLSRRSPDRIRRWRSRATAGCDCPTAAGDLPGAAASRRPPRYRCSA